MIDVKDKQSLIGVELIVNEPPTCWDDYLNDNYPLRLEYPRLVTLIEIDKSTDSATCGSYGWSLKELLEVAVYANDENKKNISEQVKYNTKRSQVSKQITEKLDEIKEKLLKNFDSVVSSGCLTDEYFGDNYLLTMALFNNLCQTNPFAPKSKQTQKEFQNINRFI